MMTTTFASSRTNAALATADLAWWRKRRRVFLRCRSRESRKVFARSRPRRVVLRVVRAVDDDDDDDDDAPRGDDDVRNDENEGVLLAAGLGGVVASCVTGTLYTLKNTGCGLPAGLEASLARLKVSLISALLDCSGERVRERRRGADYRLGRTRCSDWRKASRSSWHSPACTLASLRLSITGTFRTPSSRRRKCVTKPQRKARRRGVSRRTAHTSAPNTKITKQHQHQKHQ